jgi:hypothetical protein
VIGVANINEAAGRSYAPGRCAFPSLSHSLGMIRASAKAMFERAFALDNSSIAGRTEFTLRADLRGIAERAPYRLLTDALPCGLYPPDGDGDQRVAEQLRPLYSRRVGSTLAQSTPDQSRCAPNLVARSPMTSAVSN